MTGYVLSLAKGKKEGVLRMKFSADGVTRTLTLTEEEYCDLGCPLRDEELSEDALFFLSEKEKYETAKEAALRLLSYADNNRRTLIRKLTLKGHARETAERVAEEMISLGYINEERQLEHLIESAANRGLYGPAKITAKLLSRGYAAADIRRVFLRLCEEGVISPEENREALILKKLGTAPDPDEKKQLLYRYGYKT